MRQHQKLLTLAAVVAGVALTGCASRQPAPTSVVVVPTQTQPLPVSQAASTVRSGTIVAVEGTNTTGMTGSQGSGGGTTVSGTTSSEQLLTIQFDDGQRLQYRLGAGSQSFKVGDRVTVNTNQETALIMR